MLDEYKGDVKDMMDPSRQKRRRGPKQNMYGSNTGKDFDPHQVPFKKYFIDRTIQNVLIDFEDYMLVARQGGTSSIIRAKTAEQYNKKNDHDEDIRSSVVQSVSFYLKLFLYVLSL